MSTKGRGGGKGRREGEEGEEEGGESKGQRVGDRRRCLPSGLNHSKADVFVEPLSLNGLSFKVVLLCMSCLLQYLWALDIPSIIR